MWWWLVGFWLAGSVLFVPILCLREMLTGRKEEVTPRDISARPVPSMGPILNAPIRPRHALTGLAVRE
jgi:hypothetical protein